MAEDKSDKTKNKTFLKYKSMFSEDDISINFIQNSINQESIGYDKEAERLFMYNDDKLLDEIMKEVVDCVDECCDIKIPFESLLRPPSIDFEEKCYLIG